MRWKAKPEYGLGDIRIVNKFLLFPRCIEGEWRWLEKAKFKQELERTYGQYNYLYWEDICWIID